MSDDNTTIEIFSKKPLSKVQAEEANTEAEIDAYFLDAVSNLLDQYQDLALENKLKGIFIGGVTDEGIIIPSHFQRDSKHILHLNLAAKELSESLSFGAAMQYGLVAPQEDQ